MCIYILLFFTNSITALSLFLSLPLSHSHTHTHYSLSLSLSLSLRLHDDNDIEYTHVLGIYIYMYVYILHIYIYFILFLLYIRIYVYIYIKHTKELVDGDLSMYVNILTHMIENSLSIEDGEEIFIKCLKLMYALSLPKFEFIRIINNTNNNIKNNNNEEGKHDVIVVGGSENGGMQLGLFLCESMCCFIIILYLIFLSLSSLTHSLSLTHTHSLYISHSISLFLPFFLSISLITAGEVIINDDEEKKEEKKESTSVKEYHISTFMIHIKAVINEISKLKVLMNE